MPIWASISDVSARVTQGAISVSSSPSTAEVEAWIEEHEAELVGVLAAAGLATSYTAGTTGALIIRRRVANAVAGQVREAWASAMGDGAQTDGTQFQDKWYQFLEDIRQRRVQLGGELSAGILPDTVAQARAYSSNNNDGLSVDDGDFGPVITSRETF